MNRKANQPEMGGCAAKDRLSAEAQMAISKLFDSEATSRPVNFSQSVRNRRRNKPRQSGQTQKMRDFRNSVWLIARGLAPIETRGSLRAACCGGIGIGVAARQGSDCSCL